MENTERGVDPTEAFLALQQVVAKETTRFYTELAIKDAYINQLEKKIEELEEKLNGQG